MWRLTPPNKNSRTWRRLRWPRQSENELIHAIRFSPTPCIAMLIPQQRRPPCKSYGNFGIVSRYGSGRSSLLRGQLSYQCEHLTRPTRDQLALHSRLATSPSRDAGRWNLQCELPEVISTRLTSTPASRPASRKTIWPALLLNAPMWI